MRMVGERVGISHRGKFEPGTKIRQKAANFDPGTDLRRTRCSGVSRVARICGGHAAREFRGCTDLRRTRCSGVSRVHGFAADAPLGSFEGGTDLRRTHGSGVSRVARICGGHAARDFRGWHGFAADAPLGGFEGGTDLPPLEIPTPFPAPFSSGAGETPRFFSPQSPHTRRAERGNPGYIM